MNLPSRGVGSVVLQMRLIMTTVLKDKDPLIVPVSIRRRAGLRPGDRIEFKASRGVITIVNQSQHPLTEGTPEQRRVIDAQLAEGLDDIRKGRVSPRFDSVEEMLASLKGTSPKATRKAARAAKTPSR
jgi:bifunctional DNA-binding transcriptional regulator/antitoxin component of YhaV-PrlF toxin-antitoxin module